MKKATIKIVTGAIIASTIISGVNVPYNVLAQAEETTSTTLVGTTISSKTEVPALINGDFENPLVNPAAVHNFTTFNETEVPGWHTTASDHLIDILKNGFNEDAGLPNVTTPFGKQWAELNGTQPAALYQDIPTTPGTKVRWQVYHKGRLGKDTALVEFGKPNGTLVQQANMVDDRFEWGLYTGTYTIPAGQTTTRFQFRSVSAAGGNQAQGNFLDNVRFAVPSELEVSGEFSQSFTRIAQAVDYNVHVANVGGMPAANNTVTVKIPEELTYTAGSLSSSNTTISNEQYNAATRTLTFSVGTLDKDAEADIAIPLTGKTIATAATPDTSVTYNDENFDEDVYTADSTDTSIKVIAPSVLAVENGMPTVMQANKTYKPQFVIENTGGMASQSTDMTIQIPEEMEYQEDTVMVDGVAVTASYDASTKTLTVPVGNIQNGATSKVTFDVKAIASGTAIPTQTTVTHQDTGLTDKTYTTKSNTVYTDISSNEAPTITGDTVTKVNPNSTFDPMSTMSATDDEDGNLTSEIQVVSNDVDTSTPGTYHVTYSVKDSDDNEGTFTRTVIVTEAPVITGDAVTKVNPNSLFDAMSSMEATDEEDGDITENITVVSNNVDTKTPGNYEVTYKVIDSDGNEATFTRTVIVTEAPVITGDAITKVNPDATFDPKSTMEATDKEDGDLTDSIQVVTNDVDTSTVGTYHVTYSVTDSDGNKATFTRTVIVTEAPIITGDATTKVNPGATFDPKSTMKANDTEDGDLTSAIKVVSNDVDTSVPGTYHVTYSVVDSDGNKGTFTRTVIVTEPPVITGKATITSNPGQLVDGKALLTATDKEDGDLTDEIKVVSSTVDINTPGTYKILYSVTDSDGNTATFTQTVIITEPPVITGEATTKVNPNSLFDAMSSMKATDKEDGDITENITVESNNVDTSKSGSYKVTYKVIDSDGNEATFTRTVIVTEAPVITGEATTKVNPNSTFDAMSSMKATDKEDGDITKNITVESNNVDTKTPGNYKVTYKVIDSDGNEATFTRTVIVTEAPVITGEATTKVNPNSLFDAMSSMKATDKEDGDITENITVESNNVDTSKSGSYKVTYKVIDSDGNEATFTRTVIVTEAPVITGEATTKVNPNSLFDAMSSMKATDKEDGDLTKNITVESNNVDTKTPGNYEVTYKVVDSDGNEATFTRTVIVTEVPVITGEATTKVNPNSLFDVMSSMKATDKEDGDLTKNITVESNNVDTSKSGSYKVIYKVVDADGRKRNDIYTHSYRDRSASHHRRSDNKSKSKQPI
ncbi:immunoglobulin-like domain-containing protein [Listeria rustica]|uniref:DUF5011 domain-containing protein n=1 Tax=Listeria rustica TaxID=2713503 RepID=A0A7W1T6L9_9LIST|nr:immunoglobulin-like domain-containing protein [Listeria rustica]MBA3926271.1 DUF5011 domain-containing protein [Listeria rustica]